MGPTSEVPNAEAWGDSSSDYDDCFAPVTASAARIALDALSLNESTRFLDVAAGTGATSLEAARRGAEVTAVDFSEGMLTRLQERATSEGIRGITTKVMDAQALNLPDMSFDAAGSSFGVVFCPDLDAALHEMHRVLRPGGRAFVSAFPAGMPSPVVVHIFAALGEAGFRPPPGMAAPPGLMAADDLGERLRIAGFADVRAETTNASWQIADPRAFWRRWALDAPPVRAATREIDAATRDRAEALFVERVGSASSVLPTPVAIASGCA